MVKKIIAFILFVALIFTGVYFYNKKNIVKNEAHIATIGNEKISVPEFLMYLYSQKKYFELDGGVEIWKADFNGTPAEELAKTKALDTIKLVKVSANEAEKRGIVLDEAEYLEAEKSKNSFLTSTPESIKNKINISDEELIKAMTDMQLYIKLNKSITKNLESDYSTKNFNDFSVSIKKERLPQIYDVFAKGIFLNFDGLDTNSKNEVIIKSEEIYQEAANGKDFDLLIKNYSENTVLENETNIKDLDLKDDYILYELKPNDIETLYDEKGIYIIKVTKVDIKETVNIEEEIREKYSVYEKNQVFNEEYSKWLMKTQVDVNEDVWNSISIHLFD